MALTTHSLPYPLFVEGLYKVVTDELAREPQPRNDRVRVMLVILLVGDVAISSFTLIRAGRHVLTTGITTAATGPLRGEEGLWLGLTRGQVTSKEEETRDRHRDDKPTVRHASNS